MRSSATGSCDSLVPGTALKSFSRASSKCSELLSHFSTSLFCFIIMCDVCACACALECKCPQRPEMLDPLGARVTSGL